MGAWRTEPLGWLHPPEFPSLLSDGVLFKGPEERRELGLGVGGWLGDWVPGGLLLILAV